MPDETGGTGGGVQRASLQIGVDSTNSKSELQQVTDGLGKLQRATVGLGAQASTASKPLGAFGGVISGVKGAILGLAATFSLGVVINGIRTFAIGTINAADKLGDLSRQLGVSTEFLSTLQYIAGQSGATLDDFAAGIKNAQRNLELFATVGDKGVGRTLDTVGGGFKELVLSGAAFEDVLIGLSQRLKGLSSAQQIVVAQELFGRTGPALIPSLLEDFGAAQSKVGRFGGLITQDQVQAADEFNDAIGDVKLAIQGFSNAIVLDVLPPITDAIEEIVNLFVDNRSSILNFFADIVDGVRNVAAVLPDIKNVIEGFGKLLALTPIGTQVRTAKVVVDFVAKDPSKISNIAQAIINPAGFAAKKIAENIALRSEGPAEFDPTQVLPVTPPKGTVIDALAGVSERLRQSALDPNFNRRYGPRQSQGGRVLATDEDKDKARRIASAKERLEEYTDKQQLEIDNIFKSNEAREKAIELYELEKLLKEANIVNIEGESAKLGKQIDELNRLKQLKEVANDIGQAFGTALGNIALDIKNVGDYLKQFILDFNRAIVQAAIVKPAAQYASQVVGIVSSAVTEYIAGGSGSGPAANSDIGYVDVGQGRADGDVFSRYGRSYYSYGGKVNQFDEPGNDEGILPLSRDAAGRLGVRAVGGSGGTRIGATINVYTPDAEGFRKSKGQIASDISRQLRRKV